MDGAGSEGRTAKGPDDPAENGDEGGDHTSGACPRRVRQVESISSFSKKETGSAKVRF